MNQDGEIRYLGEGDKDRAEEILLSEREAQLLRAIPAKERVAAYASLTETAEPCNVSGSALLKRANRFVKSRSAAIV